MMRIAHALLLGSLLVVGCERNDTSAPVAQPAAPAEQIERETARLNEWFNARYEEQLDFSPLAKTRLGRKDDYDRIDDFSESGQDAQLEWRRQTVRNLEREFDRAQLTAEGRTSYDLWVYALQRAENALPFRRRGYVFHQMDGVHTGLPQQLITLHRVDDESDMTAYVARIGEVGRAVDQQLERARLAADEGVHAPRFAYEAVLQQARAIVTGAPFAGTGDSPLYADAQAKIAALVAGGKITAARGEELRAATATALTERLKPAYDALVAWVEVDQANTDAVATGVWKLPDGPAFYEERLAAMTTTAMTADEIHELGLAEVARIHRRDGGHQATGRLRRHAAGVLRSPFAATRDSDFRTPTRAAKATCKRPATSTPRSKRACLTTSASGRRAGSSSSVSKRFASCRAPRSITSRERPTARVPERITCISST